MKLNICEFRNITLKVKKSAGGFFYNAWIAGRYFWIGIWDRLQINAILSLLNTKFKVIIQNGLRIFWAIYIDLCPMPTVGDVCGSVSVLQVFRVPQIPNQKWP